MILVAALLAATLGQDLSPAIDPATVAQANVLRGTMQGHADRDRARQRGRRAAPALSETCRQAWLQRDRMSRTQRQRLYDRCPR